MKFYILGDKTFETDFNSHMTPQLCHFWKKIIQLIRTIRFSNIFRKKGFQVHIEVSH